MSLPDDKWLMMFLVCSALLHIISLMGIWALIASLNMLKDKLDIESMLWRRNLGEWAARVQVLERMVYEVDETE